MTASVEGVLNRGERTERGFGQSALSIISSWPAWAMVVVLAAVALGIGSVHPNQPSTAARIAHLESIIKCPSCIDLSIAQSDAPISVGLRSEVANWVHDGLSDTQVEQLVVARFGEQALLVPSGSGVDVLLWALPVAVFFVAGLLVGSYLWKRRRLEAAR